MEGEEIGLVLARASELRSRVADCINGNDANGRVAKKEEEEKEEGEEEDELTESLLGIRDALESLEQKLTVLQALQQQQRYEREAILNQIDHSRRMLLSKLRVYRGQDLEVLHEAATFAGETVDHDHSLILPPYPTHLDSLFVLDDLYSPEYAPRLSSNGVTHKAKGSTDVPEKKHMSQPDSSAPRGIRSFIGWVAKSAIAFVSVISILSIAGYKPMLRKNAIKFEAPGLFSKPATDEREGSFQCPPGKVLVIENGTTRCLVKERVEMPFESDVTSPSIRYGFG